MCSPIHEFLPCTSFTAPSLSILNQKASGVYWREIGTTVKHWVILSKPPLVIIRDWCTQIHKHTHAHMQKDRHTHACMQTETLLFCKAQTLLFAIWDPHVSHSLTAFCLLPLATQTPRKLLSSRITTATAAWTDSFQHSSSLQDTLPLYMSFWRQIPVEEAAIEMLCNPHGNLPASSLETAVPPWLICLVPVGLGPLSCVSVLSKSVNRSC